MKYLFCLKRNNVEDLDKIRPYILKEVLQRQIWHMNQHYRPQLYYCDPCTIASLDGIIKIETFKLDMQIARILMGKTVRNHIVARIKKFWPRPKLCASLCVA